MTHFGDDHHHPSPQVTEEAEERSEKGAEEVRKDAEVIIIDDDDDDSGGKGCDVLQVVELAAAEMGVRKEQATEVEGVNSGVDGAFEEQDAGVHGKSVEEAVGGVDVVEAVEAAEVAREADKWDPCALYVGQWVADTRMHLFFQSYTPSGMHAPSHARTGAHRHPASHRSRPLLATDAS